MAPSNLVSLAKEWCTHFHDGQIRKGNGAPYHTHPIIVAEILQRYGWDDEAHQCMALLHDVVEDTEVIMGQVKEVFGYEVANGIYVLSKNTISPAVLTHMEMAYGQTFTIEEAYKIRIATARKKVKRVKIADMIHNTTDIMNLNPSGRERKVADAQGFYIPIGQEVSPIMIKELQGNIENYLRKVA